MRSSGSNRTTPSPSTVGARAWPNWETWPGLGGLRPGHRLAPGIRVRVLQPGLYPTPNGRPRRALEDFDKAIYLEPRNHIFFFCRGLAHRELGESALAISDFETAIELEPLSNPSRLGRAVARVMQGEYEGALQDFDPRWS